MAREHNIDLSQRPGTGAGGRITKQDVEAYIAAGAASSAARLHPRPHRWRRPSCPLAASAKSRIEPMSTMRLKIAEHM